MEPYTPRVVVVGYMFNLFGDNNRRTPKRKRLRCLHPHWLFSAPSGLLSERSCRFTAPLEPLSAFHWCAADLGRCAQNAHVCAAAHLCRICRPPPQLLESFGCLAPGCGPRRRMVEWVRACCSQHTKQPDHRSVFTDSG